MYTDPISDMLTRIRNALAAGKQDLVLPYSKFKHGLAKVLLDEGFLSGVNELPGRIKMLQINLKYDGSGGSVISGIKRVSTPGQRIYMPVGKIPRTNGGYGVTVISTSKGLLTDKQARKDRVGGEVVCQVW
ncbi:MAG TPA: 30S ribosomal protein S8 [Candidatus Doudnabacteria bacterium]|nr:30S ribosomal protein S8 [Candidatus Doudnabacteria bacterium]